jgi:hypothetical protein
MPVRQVMRPAAGITGEYSGSGEGLCTMELSIIKPLGVPGLDARHLSLLSQRGLPWTATSF